MAAPDAAARGDGGVDNRDIHRNADVLAAIEAAGFQLVSLRAYSPDFTPIEVAFAKRKDRLRAVASRTLAMLLAAIGTGLTPITTTEIAGNQRHCGFALPESATHPL